MREDNMKLIQIKSQLLSPVIIVSLLLIRSTIAARILAICDFPAYSHNAVYQPIWKELSLRGHQIVSISTDPIRDKSLTNLTEIDISAIGYPLWRETIKNVMKKHHSPIEYITKYYNALDNIFDGIFSLEEINALRNETFDLVISEWIHPAQFGFSALYNCPLITVGSLEPINPIYSILGNPLNPLVFQDFTVRDNGRFQESLYKRVINLRGYIQFALYYHYTIYPNCDQLIRKHLGENLPSVVDIMKSTSIHFINTNFVLNTPKMFSPTFKTFSLLHIKTPEPLPQDIQQFLDSAKKGAVYFSLGSNIKSDMLPTSLHLLLMETFRELPYKILWKDNNPDIKNVPGNVFVSKWFPQNDILAHENVKVFVTQGGMQSVEEALMRKKPMVGIPLLVDQHKNIFKLEKHQIAVYVELSTITKEILKEAIITVAENQTYKKNIEKISDLLQDEPMKSLDMIVWWIEYVIRHNGTEHFRSPYFTTTWVEQMGVDIFAIMFLFIICLVIVLRGIFKFIVRCFGKIFSKSDKKKTQ